MLVKNGLLIRQLSQSLYSPHHTSYSFPLFQKQSIFITFTLKLRSFSLYISLSKLIYNDPLRIHFVFLFISTLKNRAYSVFTSFVQPQISYTMNNQDFLKTQSCVLRVNIHCDGCKDKVKKILRKIDGVYTIKIEAEQGKVTVTGSVDPSVLIKKLVKNGKHAQLWGPPSKGGSNNQQQFMNLNNQFKNMNFDGGKIGKDNSNNNNGGGNKGQKGGKDQQNVKGGQQQPLQQPQQQSLQHQQQMLQFLQQQMGGAKKDFKMAPPPIGSNDQKGVKFNLPNDDFDDGCDDDEYDDDDEFDDDEYDDEFDDDDMYGGGGHHPPTKMNIPMTGNLHAHGGKGGGGGDMKGMLLGGKSEDNKGKDGKKDGKNGGGGKDKGQNGNFHPNQGGGKNNGGGGKGENGNQKGGPKPNNGGHNGNNTGNPNGGQKGGGGIGGLGFSDFNHGKNSGPNMGMMGQNMMQMQPRAAAGLSAGPPHMTGGHNGNNPKNNANANGGKKGNGGLVGNDFDGLNHGKNNGPNMGPMAPMGMGNYSMAPMGPMGQSMIQPPAATGLPAGPPPHMMNGGGGGGYYQGGPMGPFNNPQQQQYMTMMMNQQRMNGGDPYGGMYPPQAMMYGRPQMGVGYGPGMVPPPTYHDPYTSYFSDENTSNSCSLM